MSVCYEPKIDALRHCVEFVEEHPAIHQPVLITTRTSQGEREYRGVKFRLWPSSLYAYMLGANLLRNLDIADPAAGDSLLKSGEALAAN